MAEQDFSTLPVSVRVAVGGGRSPEEAARVVRELEDETHTIESLARLGVRIVEVTFGSDADTEYRGEQQ